MLPEAESRSDVPVVDQPMKRAGEIAYVWPMTQAQGERAYEQNARRQERARSMSTAAADQRQST